MKPNSPRFNSSSDACLHAVATAISDYATELFRASRALLFQLLLHVLRRFSCADLPQILIFTTHSLSIIDLQAFSNVNNACRSGPELVSAAMKVIKASKAPIEFDVIDNIVDRVSAVFIHAFNTILARTLANHTPCR